MGKGLRFIYMYKLGTVLLAFINPGMKKCPSEVNLDGMMSGLLSDCFTLTVSSSSS